MITHRQVIWLYVTAKGEYGISELQCINDYMVCAIQSTFIPRGAPQPANLRGYAALQSAKVAIIT